MNTQKLLIISENDLERNASKTIKILRKNGYWITFARGPLRVEEVMLAYSPYFIIWDQRSTNISLSLDIARIINQFDLAGMLFVLSAKGLNESLKTELTFDYQKINSFDRPKELLRILSGERKTVGSTVSEKDFIGMLGVGTTSPLTNKESTDRPSPQKKFENWNPTDNDIKIALSLATPTKKTVFQRLKSVFIS